ncbi:coiled-coil domain-containing protein 43-like [Ptychodera flava]|uniref:coiled-coil domain-containing protein 43-like n=1 Tax=Ptychodera flava TaxID=63121 RepID=UPI00396AA2D3
MAAAVSESSFDVWLSAKLSKLNIDQEVFGSYITGILETDDSSHEDKTEDLVSFFSEITEDGVEDTCREIISKWNETQKEKEVEAEKLKAEEKAANDQAVANLMEKHATSIVKKELSNEERQRKAALLKQYGDVSEEEESDDNGDGNDVGAFPNQDSSLFKNTNKTDVTSKERAKRDKAKQDHEKKKERDKLQREKDKQKALDRKEKEKKRTQKQERRR